MERHEQLQNEYLHTLAQYIQALKEQESAAKAQGDQAAAVQQKIKVNVAEIFQKMFQISYNNVYVKRQIPDFVKYEEAYPEQPERLRAAYLDFFHKIPGPWKEKAEKDQRFGRLAEYEIEQVKLAVAAEVKELFQNQFSSIFGE